MASVLRFLLFVQYSVVVHSYRETSGNVAQLRSEGSSMHSLMTQMKLSSLASEKRLLAELGGSDTTVIVLVILFPVFVVLVGLVGYFLYTSSRKSFAHKYTLPADRLTSDDRTPLSQASEKSMTPGYSTDYAYLESKIFPNTTPPSDLSMSGSGYERRREDVILQGMVVPQEGGLQFTLPGTIKPHKQSATLDVKKIAHEEPLLRLVMDEAAAADSGVLALMDNDFPLMFIDTSAAVALKGEPSPPDENRRVVIKQSVMENHMQFLPWGVVQKVRPNIFEARRCRSDGQLGNVLASVIASGPTMSVTNPQNQLIAAVRVVSPDTNTRVLTVQYDVDALFMISLVVAVGKLA